MDEKDTQNLNNQPDMSNNINNNQNLVDQNTEDNPYYNPYFQNTDLTNSPYLNENGSDVTLNNDIYNQTYMNSGMDNMEDATQDNIAPEPTQQDNSQDSVNLFDMGNYAESSASTSESSSQVDSDQGSTQNILPGFEPEQQQNILPGVESAEVPNTETSSEVESNQSFNGNIPQHINPILRQSITPTTSNTSEQNIGDSISYNEPNQNFNTGMNYNEPSQSFNAGMNYNEPSQSFNTDTNYNFNTDSVNNTNAQFNSNTGFDNVDPQEYQNSTSSFGSNSDDEFVRNWMGSLYDKASHRKFNIPAFLFGGLYYLYRKVYIFGFIFLLVSCLLPTIGLSISSSSGNISLAFIFTILSIIVNIAYGFSFYPIYKGTVQKALNTAKNQVQDPAQLIDIAKKKGGKSIPLLILGIVLNSIITFIAFTTILVAAITHLIDILLPNISIGNNPSTPGVTNEFGNNTIVDQPTNSTFNFYQDYILEYDPTSWQENANHVLVSGNYSLSYIQSIETLGNYGFDINTPEGRNSFHTYLYNLFSSQINSATTTIELGESSFVYDLGIYYSYLDLVYETSIERCYFVLVPDDDIFIEFILSNTDTVISDDVHQQVISEITTISKENNQTNAGNNISGTVGGNSSNVNSTNDNTSNNSSNNNQNSNVNSNTSSTQGGISLIN